MKRITEQVNAADLYKLPGKAIQLARTEAAEVLARESAKEERERLETLFLFAWRGIGGPEPLRQYRFAERSRYAFDFCWYQPQTLAVEINGGQWTKSGHSSGKGLQRDSKKSNLAIELGWRVLTFVTDDMKNPVQVAEQVLKILKGKYS